MANHFRALGFNVRSETTFRQFVEQIMKYGVDVPFVGGETTRWTLDCGIDHWAQTRANAAGGEEFVGVSLHHLGDTRLSARIGAVCTLPVDFDAAAMTPEDTMIEARLRLDYVTKSGATASIWVDAVDYAQQRAVYTVGAEHTFQLAAFTGAVEVTAASADAPQASATSSGEPESALHHQVPATLSGVLRSVADKENGDTDAPYCHAVIECGAASFELLVHALPTGAVAGAWVHCTATLTALRIEA